MTVTSEVVESIATPDGLVKFTDIVQASGLPRSTFQTAITEGLITPVGTQRRQGSPLTFTKEDAILLLTVAALAVLAGVAFVSLLKAMKQAGAKVDGNAITINMPGAGS